MNVRRQADANIGLQTHETLCPEAVNAFHSESVLSSTGFPPLYSGHKAKHQALRPDGQQNEYVTLHPTGRYEGTLAGVPQCYRHPKCGVVTRMPEDIIRSYLVNPFLYGAGSFCCGCGEHIPEEELFWTETGQNMAEYTCELRDAYIRKHGAPPPAQG